MELFIVPSLWVGEVYPYMSNSVYDGIAKASLASI